MNQLQLFFLVNLLAISLNPLVSAQTKANLSPATVSVEEKNEKAREGTHPLLLSWIVFDQQNKQTVLNEEHFPKEASILKKQAQQHGLSMLFPILDIEDMTTLTYSEVIKGTKTPVMKIAERYGVEAILVGWLLAKEEWQGQWRLYWKNQEIPFKNNHKKINNLLEEGLDAILDARTTRALPVKSTAPVKTFEIKVTDVTTFEDYTRVAQYLQKLSIIDQLQVSQLQPKQVIFRISVAGGHTAFTKIIRSDSILTSLRRKGKTTYRLIKDAKV